MPAVVTAHAFFPESGHRTQRLIVPTDRVRHAQKIRHKVHIARQGVIYSVILCMLILLLGGVGFWLLDPAINTFADGLWLAFTTAATVGYGDMVPSTHASRTFSVVVVMLGLAVLSLTTASLSAIFVEKDVEEAEIRPFEHELMREIKHLRAEVQALRHECQREKSTPAVVATPEAAAR